MTAIPYQDITHRIIAAAMHVYNKLGSGFNEALYDKAMSVALEMQGLGFESQKAVEIFFEDAAVGLYYLDYLVEHKVVLELKALSELNSSHLAQTITYTNRNRLPSWPANQFRYKQAGMAACVSTPACSGSYQGKPSG